MEIDLTMKPKFWILSELFFPEETSTAYIMTEIAKQLSLKYDVHVIAGSPMYYSSPGYDDNLLSGVTIHRIAGMKVNKNNIIGRVFRTLCLSVSVKKILKDHAKNDDRILMVTNPPLFMLFIPPFTKKRNLKLTVLVHDVFPDNMINTGIYGRNIIYSLLKKIFQYCYQLVDNIIVCGHDMQKIIEGKIRAKGIPVYTLENWGDVERIFPENSIISQRIVIQFCGNFGRVQGLLNFLQILSCVQNPNIQIIFQGSGALKVKMKKMVKELKLTNVSFFPSYPRSEENKILNSFDIGLVTLDDSMWGLGVPSKAYNIMAAGKPILFVGPKGSEIYTMVKENGIGFAYSFSEKDEIINFFNSITIDYRGNLRVLGAKARHIVKSRYTKKIFLEKLAQII